MFIFPPEGGALETRELNEAKIRELRSKFTFEEFFISPTSLFPVKDSHVLTFPFPGGNVCIRVNFDDRQTNAEMVIVEMAVNPREEQRKGHGSRALQTLLQWAYVCEIYLICATQVQGKAAENFFKRNGFLPTGNETYDFEYVGHAT